MRVLKVVVAIALLNVLLGIHRPAMAGPFDQGKWRLSIGGGTTRNFDNTYFALGVGVGWFVMSGWEVGFEAETWLGGDPAVAKVSPLTRYIFHMVPVLHPYLGIFYKHWFIGSDYIDVDTIGGQLGVMFVTGPGFFIGGGVAHEIIISECEEDCSDTYPEIHFSISF